MPPLQVVKTKTPSGGDDGWWEGEARGRQGLFPSLAVAPIKELGLASPPLHPRVGLSPSSLLPPFPIGASPSSSTAEQLHISEQKVSGECTRCRSRWRSRCRCRSRDFWSGRRIRFRQSPSHQRSYKAVWGS